MSTNLEKIDVFDIINKINDIETDSLLFVVDEKAWAYHKDKFDMRKLSKDKRVHIWAAPRGEATKRITEFEKCLESFLEKGVHRNSHLIAVGGGALSDFAGFVASTILRGIKWSVVPTTLLSMVDASIGGKVALNSRYGKNLIGNFYMPTNVWISEEFLKTLDKDEYQSGLGEIAKYSFLSKPIFKSIKNNLAIEEIIYLCAEYKLNLCNKDPREENARKVLNLGHTFGHALEKAFSLKHGVAVLWGMILFFHLFKDNKYLNDLKIVMNNLGWEDFTPPWNNTIVPIKKIISYIQKDKKITSQDEIDLIHIKKIGEPVIKEYSLSKLTKKIQEVLNDPSTLIL